MTLADLVEELASYIPLHTQENSTVSSVTVGWQIAHSLKVVSGVLWSLEQSKPEEYERKFNWTKVVIMTIQRIPRGKGRAPKTVLPTEEEISEQGLQQQITAIQAALKNIDKISEEANFKHPLFGSLKKKETLKFLKIHTQHHVAIIRDMVKK